MSTRPHTAMILAAGFGTRMQPITLTTPKPMVKVAGIPMLDYRLDKLAEFGIKRVVINVHYLAQQIEDYLQKNGQRWPFEIIISPEKDILETGGGLVNARQHLGDDPIFILNSDVIWLDDDSPALCNMADHWRDDMDILMLAHDVSRAIGYYGTGDFELDSDGRLHQSAEPSHPYVFTGIEIFKPSLLDGRTIKAFSLSTIFKESLTANRLFGIEHQGQWLHIDSQESLDEAETFLKTR